jgi:ABC-2 type transport system permease protein
MSPMIRKELRQLMRERRGWVLPSLYLVALGGVAIFVYFQTLQMHVNAVRFLEGPDIGIPLFLALLYTQLTVLLLLVPIFSAGALTIEKEQRTIAGLLTSLLTDTQIWWGKFLSSLLFVLLLLVAGLPVLSLAFAFGGVGLWELFIVTTTTVVILGSMSAVSLYWSSVFRRSVAATAVSYASVIVLCVVSALLYVAQQATHRGAAWANLPLRARAPLLANPFFFLTLSLTDPRELYPEWWVSAGIFVLLGTVAVWLTIRNLRRNIDAG